MIVKEGGRWQWSVGGLSISAGNPKGRLEYGAYALLIWYLLRIWPGKNWREWAKVIGRVALLVTSLYVSVLVGEQVVRNALRRQQSTGTIQDLQRFEQGADINIEAAHPLAVISRVSPCKMIVYELKPNVTMDFGHTRLKTNSDGLRDDYEYARGKHTGVTRIIGIGDSGMFGWGSNQEQAYLSIIEENLATHYGDGKYQVLNMAVPGYNTFQEVEMLKYKGLAYHPDIVVVGWSRNDLSPPFLLQKRKEYDEKDISYLYLLLFDRAGLRELTRPVVLKAHEIDEEFIDPELLAQSGAQGVLNSFKSLKELSKAHGFRVLVFGPLGGKIVEMCKTAGLDYFDTFTIPKEEHPAEEVPGATLYGLHPRPNAHRFLAERLEQHMVERGWLPGTE